MVSPSGTIFAFTVKDYAIESTEESLNSALKPLKDQGLMVHSAVLDDKDFMHGARIVMQLLKTGAMRPNTLFLNLGKEENKDNTIRLLASEAHKNELGTIILRQHPRKAFGMQKNINLWLRDKSPNYHLAILIALQLRQNWQGNLNLITVGSVKSDEKRLLRFLEGLSDQARLPSMTEFHIYIDDFRGALLKAPAADINIFGLADVLDFEFMRETPDWTMSSCLFIRDSGQENALV
jgi:hypothetical protein